MQCINSNFRFLKKLSEDLLFFLIFKNVDLTCLLPESGSIKLPIVYFFLIATVTHLTVGLLFCPTSGGTQIQF